MTDLLPPTPWNEVAAHRLAGRPLILLGVGFEPMLDFARFGGRVYGFISVVPDCPGDLPHPGDTPFPVLTLRAVSRDLADLAVGRFAHALRRSARDVTAFVKECDPYREALIVSHLPVPMHIWGGRCMWAQDAEVALTLEDKRSSLEDLGCGLLVPESRDLDRHQARLEARGLVARLGPGVVLQELDLRGGGLGTWLCESEGDLQQALNLAHTPDVRVSRLIRGESWNVTGLVAAEDQVAVFPPSLQVLLPDSQGRPLYGGNLFRPDLCRPWQADMAKEVREVGGHISWQGFRGPFGLDFIVDEEGRRFYHDLNPRVNGVVDSLSLLLEEEGVHPLRVLLLSRETWNPSDLERLEKDMADLVEACPPQRFFPSVVAGRPTTWHSVPEPGLWRLQAEPLRASPLEGPASLYEVSGDVALLIPLLGPGARVEAGDRVHLGNLLVSVEMADALLAGDIRSLPGALMQAFGLEGEPG